MAQRRALLSVFDKTGLAEFARGLSGLGFELVSTGGTASALEEAGVAVTPVAEVTGAPEMLGGRVKTVHPRIHAGLLARRDLPAHLAELESQGLVPIDLVASNLYPFQRTVASPDVGLDEALENIDIGGPAMIRAAAKNFPAVLVVTDPADYDAVLEMLRAGDPPLAERRHLARKAFAHTSVYDSVIAAYLAAEADGEQGFPADLAFGMTKLQDLRYGENPHQRAAFYAEAAPGVNTPYSVAWAQQLHGKELSYNNILDLDAALGAAMEFAEPSIAIVKHSNPCGLASHQDLAEAYRRAFSGDPVSAFGGILACNVPLTAAVAEAMADTFYECVIAPSFAADALAALKRKKNLRVLSMGPAVAAWGRHLEVRRVRGGFLVQTSDVFDPARLELATATRRAPTERERADLLFAWRCAKHVKSNAIVIVHDRTLLGMGAGQPNRVTSVDLAVRRAGERAAGAVLASDAFFPFPDGIEAAAAAGVTAIIQPGGSVRDRECIAAAERGDLAMVFTGVRHFRH